MHLHLPASDTNSAMSSPPLPAVNALERFESAAKVRCFLPDDVSSGTRIFTRSPVYNAGVGSVHANAPEPVSGVACKSPVLF
jgi:hypothetical protein